MTSPVLISVEHELSCLIYRAVLNPENIKTIKLYKITFHGLPNTESAYIYKITYSKITETVILKLYLELL